MKKMKKMAAAWCAGAICVGMLAGCGGGQKAAAVKSAASDAKGAEEKASELKAVVDEKPVQGDVISVTLTGSKDLNTFNNQPHTLVLVLYQLSQSGVFSQFLETPEGKAKLLAGDSFDATVLARRRLVLQPGEAQQVILDRVDGAKYLGAVAGYYNEQPKDVSRVLPVARETTGMLSWKKPKPQTVHFSLGRTGFVQ